MRRFAKGGERRVRRRAPMPAEAEAWLVEALALKRDWLKRDRPCQPRLHQAGNRRLPRRACLARLARRRRPPRMVVSKLGLDGRTAAIEVGIPPSRHLSSLSPRLCAEACAARAGQRADGAHARLVRGERHVDRYDMMAPRSRNKSEWKSDEVAVVDFALPMTLGGRLYAELVVKVLGARDPRQLSMRFRHGCARGCGPGAEVTGGSRGASTIRRAEKPARRWGVRGLEASMRHCRQISYPAARRGRKSRSPGSRQAARRLRGRGRLGARPARRARARVAALGSACQARSRSLPELCPNPHLGAAISSRDDGGPGSTSRWCATAGRAVLILPLGDLGHRPHLAIARIAGDPIAQYADLHSRSGRAPRAPPSRPRSPRSAAGADAIVLRRAPRRFRISSASPQPHLRPATARTRRALRGPQRLRRLPGLSCRASPRRCARACAIGAITWNRPGPSVSSYTCGGAEARAAVAEADRPEAQMAGPARQPVEPPSSIRRPAHACSTSAESSDSGAVVDAALSWRRDGGDPLRLRISRHALRLSQRL